MQTNYILNLEICSISELATLYMTYVERNIVEHEAFLVHQVKYMPNDSNDQTGNQCQATSNTLRINSKG